MSTYIEAEAWLAAHSFFLGITLMASYDFLRLLRLLIPHSALAVSLEDFAYWVYAAVMTFSLLFRENDGAFRAYVVIFAFAAMFLYDRIVSENVFRLLQNIKNRVTIKGSIRKSDRKKRKHGSEP